MSDFQNISALMSKKASMEDELNTLHNELKMIGTNLTENLIDNEGFPRSDIDILSTRIVRNKINCLQNDYKDLMKIIENILYDLHSHKNHEIAKEMEKLDNSITKEGFLKISSVEKQSPAFIAGLKPGDEILQFGSMTKNNFDGLSSVAQIVQHSKNKTILLRVRSGSEVKILKLKPKEWTGIGLIGCHIIIKN
ncbi:DgyrCDS4292 [Dimorphilus gyrociliatus]|uniref:26S proteasome non-ATPase regulatory subunit 9 n=1 Tax=Dimorphilus gyrociliatus TaxID=2664684 RepID=A0A7I8VGJ4_9ANNE|nr:DgyrCDS4292 [Dimorphilus gyrociliatus]